MHTTYKHYYIATGASAKLYTLRCQEHITVSLPTGGARQEQRDYYIKTLCADSDRAIKKAHEYVDTKHADDETKPKLMTSGAKEKIYKITHRSPEVIERIRTRKAFSEGIRKGLAFKKWTIEAHKKLDDEIVPFGYWKDVKIEEMPMKNIQYFASLTEYKSEIHKRLSDLCKPHCKDVFEDRNKHFANINEKKNIKAMIVKIDRYRTDWGVHYSVQYITEQGHRLKTFGSCTTAFNRSIIDDYSVYDMIEFEATVKEHKVFEMGNESSPNIYKSTKLIRPKLTK